MSVNYPVTIRNSRLLLVLNAIDGAASNGFLRLLDGLGNILSSMQLSRPSATIAFGIMTFNSLPLVDPAAAGTGLAAAARFEDGSGNIIISGLTVGIAPGAYDIFLPNTTLIAAGQTVALTAATITSA